MSRHIFLYSLVTLLSLCTASVAAARVMNGSAIVHQAGSLNMCALTFDDGPSQYTSQLLDSLQKEGIPATFFVLGKQVERHPDLILRMVREGHEVGSHSYSHPNFRKLGPAAQLEELARTSALLAELGARPISFRPPYGKYSDMTIALAEEMGMSIVLWSSDSQDWKRRPVDYSKMRTTTGRPSLPGEMQGVFLFHDIRKATVDDIHRIITTLRAGGCQRFVTIQDYMNADQQDERLYTAAPPVQIQGPQGALNSTVPAAETTIEEDELLAQMPNDLSATPKAPAHMATTNTADANAVKPIADKPTAAANTAPTQSPKADAQSSGPDAPPVARTNLLWPWSLFSKSGT